MLRGPGVLVLLLAIGVGSAIHGRTQPQNPAPQTPTFRGGTRLVPVDVRVVDRAGRPVTDLTEKDFELLENGVRQTLSHFSVQSLLAEAARPADRQLMRNSDPAPAIGTQSHRVFLIVLGRGRLQPPARGVDGMIHFVRRRLLPQDLVAVMAWNRATDFTTDHGRIAETLERFRQQHERIEGLLQLHFSGLAAIYGSRDIPARLQTDIDGVFAGSGARSVVDGSLPDAKRVAADERRLVDALQRRETTAGRDPGTFLDSDDPLALGLDMSLDELTSMTAQSMQDVAKITAGIQYLRYLHGEKHLLFVSPSGVFLPRGEDDRNLAALASDARVAIDVVHTGGIGGNPFDWRRMTSRTVAEDTGGTFSSTSYARDFVDRLDQTTRFQYTLGYYPTNATLDGRFRRIAVRVRRPGVQVFYRHGYFATRELPPLDRRRIVSYSRVANAANLPREVQDIALTLAAENGAAADRTRQVQVDLRIAPERLSLVEKDGRRHGSIEVALFVADGGERLIGQAWNTINFEMTPDAYERFMKNGLRYTSRVRVSTQARHVKAIVYDYGADLLGASAIRIR